MAVSMQESKKTKILFFHFDLGNGGAEKVLVNLANNLDPQKYDITVKTLFNSGVNRKFLMPHIKYRYVFNRAPFRGISPLMELVSPRILHNLMIKDKYDIEISYREGCTNRIISGCPNPDTKIFGWIHISMDDRQKFIQGFRSFSEAVRCHSKFVKTATVSDWATESVRKLMPKQDVQTVHNMVEREKILNLSKEEIDLQLDSSVINLCSVGRLTSQKSFDRLIQALSNLYSKGLDNWHLYIIGVGSLKDQLTELTRRFNLTDQISFLGYRENPYKYVSKMDLFVCSSLYEGYSTAVTESIIVGTPVLTTECSGMNEIFGEVGGGKIVENSLDGLQNGLENFLTNKDLISPLKVQAKKRSVYFSEENSIRQFEDFISE